MARSTASGGGPPLKLTSAAKASQARGYGLLKQIPPHVQGPQRNTTKPGRR
jgi:hypothetical protein